MPLPLFGDDPIAMSNTTPSTAESTATQQSFRRTETRLAPEQAASVRRDPPEMLALNETAAYLGIAVRTVRDRIRDRSIPHVKLGGRVLVPLGQLRAALNRRTIGAVA